MRSCEVLIDLKQRGIYAIKGCCYANSPQSLLPDCIVEHWASLQYFGHCNRCDMCVLSSQCTTPTPTQQPKCWYCFFFYCWELAWRHASSNHGCSCVIFWHQDNFVGVEIPRQKLFDHWASSNFQSATCLPLTSLWWLYWLWWFWSCVFIIVGGFNDICDWSEQVWKCIQKCTADVGIYKHNFLPQYIQMCNYVQGVIFNPIARDNSLISQYLISPSFTCIPELLPLFQYREQQGTVVKSYSLSPISLICRISLHTSSSGAAELDWLVRFWLDHFSAIK